MAKPANESVLEGGYQHDKVFARAIDIAKGITIILVVFGHERVGHSWTQIPISIINTFHMPLFVFLSGILFDRSSPRSWAEGWLTITKKFRRLIVPYLTLSIFYFSIQVLGQSVFTFKRNIDVVLFLNIFTDPVYGPNGMLWFLYSLFVIFILQVVLSKVLRSEITVLFASIILAFFDWPHSFGLYDAFRLFPYFVLGKLSAEYCDLRSAISVSSIALPLFCLFAYLTYGGSDNLTLRIVTATAGCLMCVSLAFILEHYWESDILVVIGRYASPIYLLHAAIWAIAGRVLNKVANQYAASQELLFSLSVLILLVAAALVIPIFFTKHFIQKHPLLVKYILGSPIRAS